MTASAIKQGICQALSKVGRANPFSCSDVLELCPNPTLHVKGVGSIGLPLSNRDAKAISKSSATRRSPFGKGSDTVVDLSVRKSWQVDPSHFELRNLNFMGRS